MLVFDLDPGAPAGIVECCEVALVLRGLFEQLGLESVVKTSGSKGMQVYVPLNAESTYDADQAVRAPVAELLEQRLPELVVIAHDQAAAAGQGARRLEPERRPQDDRQRLLGAGARERPYGLDAGRLGGGRRRCRESRRPGAARASSPTTCSAGSRADGDLFAPLLSLEPG